MATHATLDAPGLAGLSVRIAASAQAWNPGCRVVAVRPLAGGSSSLTFTVKLADRPPGADQIVVKVAPPGLTPVRNRDVIRQGRLMSALQGAPRRLAPTVLFDDEGDPPDVPPYVAMSMVAGECIEPVLVDDAQRPRAEVTRARYLDAARILADLHSIVPADTGLAHEPVVSLSEEVSRWTKAFATLPDDLRGDYFTCERALLATMPASMGPVVNHGDYRLGNTLCIAGQVEAIIDWEIWSIGDPRVDLTWLTYFTDDAHHPGAVPGSPAGTPSQAEVIAAYEAAIGRRVPDLRWFDALTTYKEAAATGLLIKRARKNAELPAAFVRMLPRLPAMLDHAIEILER